MKIKVCGMREAQNIEAVAGLKPDYLGFIFYAKSARYAAGLSAGVLNNLPDDIVKTAVFVNEDISVIRNLIDQYGFDAVQLHGDESPQFCAELRTQVTVIKAFGVDEQFDFGILNAYAGQVDFFLFDTKTQQHGGSGKTFDWKVLDKYDLDVPFFLSGGLSPDNLEGVKSIKHSAFYGVDLNSKFETAPGVKNVEKLEQAFELLNK